jgi:hypothetical protein
MSTECPDAANVIDITGSMSPAAPRFPRSSTKQTKKGNLATFTDVIAPMILSNKARAEQFSADFQGTALMPDPRSGHGLPFPMKGSGDFRLELD